MFFDDYPYFLETSQVFADLERLNLRYEAICNANRDVFQGAKVLDLASHDGRWSFAALKTGAAHVTGIEARSEAVDNAYAAFKHYDVDPDSYRFIHGDVFKVLREQTFDVDLVLCLGYLYHTYRHTELLHRIRQLEPTYLIVDTSIVPNRNDALVKLYVDRPDKPGEAALDEYAGDGVTLVGRPSLPALKAMLQAYSFGVEHEYDWDSLLAKSGATLAGYSGGARVTLRCRAGTGSLPPRKVPQVTEADADQTDRPAAPASARRWRSMINRGLGRLTGYELRRVRRARRQTGSDS